MSVVLFLPLSLLFSTTIIISPDVVKQSLCVASLCHFYVSMHLFICLSISLCLSFSVTCCAVLLLYPFSFLSFSSLSFIPNTRTIHSSQVRAIRVVCSVVLGAELDAEIRQTQRLMCSIRLLQLLTLQIPYTPFSRRNTACSESCA